MKFNETIGKYKARLVSKALDKKGINYFDTYPRVARITTIRLLIALASIHNLVIHQMDVKTSFLNGDLEEVKFNESGKCVIICLYVDDMLIFGIDQNQVDKTKKFLSLKFSMKDIGEAGVILGIKIKRKHVAQLEYSKVIGCLMYAMTSTRPDTTYEIEGYYDASWINHVKDSFSTSGWVFLLGGGAISWASKKQTCITSSTMKYEFVALATTGKEA
ncbi:zinc finger, CCHC-type containing protein [Tanacetum coccineum]